jgi:7-carboxy-7-deazaguanine synthase
MPAAFAGFRAAHRWVSPMDGPERARHTAEAAAFCRDNPAWRLNIQAHKFWDIP